MSTSPNSLDDYDYGALVDGLPSSTPSASAAVPSTAQSTTLLDSGKFESAAPSPVPYVTDLPVTTAVSGGCLNLPTMILCLHVMIFFVKRRDV